MGILGHCGPNFCMSASWQQRLLMWSDTRSPVKDCHCLCIWWSLTALRGFHSLHYQQLSRLIISCVYFLVYLCLSYNIDYLLSQFGSTSKAPHAPDFIDFTQDSDSDADLSHTNLPTVISRDESPTDSGESSR